MKKTSSAQTSGITYVIGHRNPDADSICSAIAYADLKRRLGEGPHLAARCGNTNERIDTILQKFQQPLPLFLNDVSPRVRDIMVQDIVEISPDTTISHALELIDSHDVRVLPVTRPDRTLEGYLSIFQLGEYFTPRLREPRRMREVRTSLRHIVSALKADILHAERENEEEFFYVKIGAMDIRSFGKFSEDDGIPPQNTIIVVGDRWDIQQKSIQTGVRLLVITGNLEVDDEVVEAARHHKVSIIRSPFDSASTAWIIRTASTIGRLVRTDFVSFSPEDPIEEVRRKVTLANALAYMVLDEERKLVGLFTKTNLLKPVQTRLILVDHNELGQAVQGASEVTITEIIDHHRLSPITTQQPILFLNDPVGSTCTIVADLYRRHQLLPTSDMAGILMGGIISDTLNLNSPTSTPKDGEILRWLEELAGVSAGELAELIFSSGSIMLSHSPSEILLADQKLYEEPVGRFSVSQVEELGFGNYLPREPELLTALDEFRKQRNLLFACLLVTDINSQNSRLLVKGDSSVRSSIQYHSKDGEVFDLPGIVSRKKQLIPYLSTVLRSLEPGTGRSSP